MFNGILETILQKVLGEYIENIDKENLHLEVWKGKVCLENMCLKKSALDKLNLPVHLVFGKIGSLFITLPWRKIFRAQIVLERVYLILGPTLEKDWRIEDIISVEAKKKMLQNYTEHILNKFHNRLKEGIQSQGSLGFFEKMMLRVIDNIQVQINDVHIRFEDTVSLCGCPYSFGFTMKGLSIVTTNEEWTPMLINRINSSNLDRPLNKLLQLENFACYLQSTPDDVFSNLGADKEIEQKMKEFSIQTRNYEDKKPSIRTSREHILLPMSLEIKLTHTGNSLNNTRPRYQGFFTIDNLCLSMHKDQLDKAQLISQLNKKYQSFVMEKSKIKKYKKYRPLYAVLTKEAGVLKTTKTRTEGAVLWWKYAITCVRLKLRKEKGVKGLFMISNSSLRRYQNKFMLYYAKTINKAKLTKKENMEYIKILSIFDFPQLKLWTSDVHSKIEKKIYEIKPKEENSETSTTSLLSNLFLLIGGEEEEKKMEDEKQAKLIASSINGIMKQTHNPEEKTEIVNKQPRIEEYFWLNINFSINKVKFQIERDKVRNEGGRFKEGIVLKLWDLNTQFMKRYWGSDFSITVGNLKLKTYFCFNSTENIKNVILSRSKHLEESKESFAKALICFSPPNSDLFVSVDVKMQSVRLYFLPLLISRLTMFIERQQAGMSPYSNKEIIENVPDNSKSELEDKKSSISITVDAPTLLVPIFKNNDISSPIWCFRLGDLNMETGFEKMYADPHYTTFQVKLAQIRLEHYSTLLAYEKFEEENQIDLHQRFRVIDDFTINMEVALARAKKDPTTPSSKISCDIDRLKMNFTPSIYNHFMNISDAFNLNEDDEAWKELIREKEIIVKSQYIDGILRKRGIGIKKFWYKKYCILSGGYLYFYESEMDEFASSYYYLKNAQIIDGVLELGISNTMILRNQLEQCYLAFTNYIEFNNWKTKIIQTIGNINNLSAINFYQKSSKVDYTDMEYRAKVNIKQFKVNIVKEDLSPIAKFNFFTTEALIDKRPADLIYSLLMHQVKLVDPNGKKFTNILDSNSLNILSSTISKESPLFKGELSLLTIDMDNATCNYAPPFIQSLMEILKNTKPNFNPVQVEDPSKGENLAADQPENEFFSMDTCNKNEYVASRIITTLKKFHLYLLHPTYNTPFCLMDITTALIDFSSFIDHEITVAQIGNFAMFDMTSYPETWSPDSEDINFDKIIPQKIVEIDSSDEDIIIDVEYTSYQLHCPKRPITPENLNGKMFIKVHPIIINLHFEYFVDRLSDYVIYQFFGSMSSKDPLAETHLLLSEKEKNSHEGKDCYEVPFITPFGYMEVHLYNVRVYLRPRSHYKDFFVICLQDVKLSNERCLKKGRWLNKPEEPFLCDIFNIDIERMSIKYNNELNSVLILKRIFLSIEMPCVEPQDSGNHSPQILDQSMKVILDSEKSLNIWIRQEQFTYFLKCLDLNILYTDGLQKKFTFRPIVAAERKEGVSYSLHTKLQAIFFTARHRNEDSLAEFCCFKSNIGLVSMNDGSKQISVDIAQLYILHGMNKDRKIILLAPVNSKNEYTVSELENKISKFGEESSCDLKSDIQPSKAVITIQIKKNSEKCLNVELQHYKSVVKSYALMLLSDFFVKGFPNYEGSPDKPPQYTNDPERYPKSTYVITLNNSIHLFPSFDINTGLALEGDLRIEMMSECISQVKTDLRLFPNRIARPINKLNIDVKNMFMFLCNLVELDGRPRKHMALRKLFEPVDVTLSSTNFLNYRTQFQSFSETKIEGGQLFISISYQDIIHLCKSFVYNINLLEKEYFERVMRLHQNEDLSDINNSDEEEQKEPLPEEDKRHMSTTNCISYFGKRKRHLDRSNSDYRPAQSKNDENIIVVLNSALEALEKLSKASNSLVKNLNEYASFYLKHHNTVKFRKEINKKTIPFWMKETKKIREESFNISKLKYQTTNIFAKKKKEKEEKVNIGDFLDINFQSLKMLVINDHNGVFCPILNLNLEKLNMSKTSNKSVFSVKLSSMYYNPTASFWEPLIEKTELGFHSNQSELQLFFNNPININLSDTLVSVLSLTWKSWNDPVKPPSPLQRTLQRSMTRFLNSGNEQGVCPFSIRNETGTKLYVYQVNHPLGKEDLISSILPNESYGIRVNYEEIIENMLKSSLNVKIANLLYKVTFPDQTYKPLENINLNTIDKGIHILNDKSEEFNYLVYSIKLDGISKILTIRTPFQFYNRTNYKCNIMYKLDLISKNFILSPHGKHSISSEYLKASFSLSIEQEGGFKDYSESYTIEKLLNLFKKQDLIEVSSGKAKLVIMQEKAIHEKLFNFSLIAPFSLKNGLPCGMRFRKAGDTKMQILEIGKKQVILDASCLSEIDFEISIPYYKPSMFHFVPTINPNTEFSINLFDPYGYALTLHIRLVLNHPAKFSFIVYAYACIINRTDSNLVYFFEKNSHYCDIAAGQIQKQEKMLLISKMPKLIVGLDANDVSPPISIQAAGINDYFEITKRNSYGLISLHEFTISSSLSLISKQKYVYTKIITIAPRYILHNKTASNLEIIQSEFYECSFLLKPGESKPLYWPNVERRKSLMLRIKNVNVKRSPASPKKSRDMNEWDWSSPFTLNELGNIVVRCERQTRNRGYLFIRIIKDQSESNINVSFEKEDVEHPLYRIENYSKYFSIAYWQKGKMAELDYLDCSSEVIYAPADNSIPLIISLQIYYGTLSLCPISVCPSEQYEFSIDNLDQQQKIEIRLGKKHGHTLFISTVTDGYTKILRLTDVLSTNSKNSGIKLYQYSLSIPNLGLSIIAHRQNQRNELVYISVEGIKVFVEEFEGELNLDLKVNNMQIDNQSALHVPYPVIFQSLVVKKNRINELEKIHFFKVSISMKTREEKIIYLNLVEIFLNIIDVKLDDEILSFIMDFAEQIMKEMQTTVSPIHEIFLGMDSNSSKECSVDTLNYLATQSGFQESLPSNSNNKLYRQHSHLISTRNVETSGKKIYIKKLSLPSIEIVLSFLKKLSSEGKFLSQAGIIMNAIGIAITNIDATPITLKAVQRDHVFGGVKEISSIILQYYSDSLIKTALKLIWSIDFIGNPVKFLSTIGTGIKDFFYQPIVGFTRGPIQGSVSGVFDGTKSLLQNTIVGTFDTVSKITSSWSKGFLALSNDREYIIKREERFLKNKAETIVDGIGYGLSSAFKSLQSGIVGVIKHPIEGTKEDGFSGFLKGTWFGLTGMIVKPICGALDFVARTSEGGKNTATIFETELECRVRNPRVFYTRFQIIQEYNKQDSDILAFLHSVRKCKLMYDHILEEYIIQTGENYFLLLITEEHIAEINILEKAVSWIFNTSELKSVYSGRNGLIVVLKNNIKFSISITDQEICKMLFESILGILNNHPQLVY